MKKLLKDARFIIFGTIILIFIILAIFAPYFTPYDYEEMDPLNRLQGSSAQHILGTDHFGRDIWTRVIYGGRLTFQISFGAVLISMTLGTLLGMSAGYFGGLVELITMRVVDFIMSFPSILIAMFVIVFIGSSVTNLVITIGIVGIASFARITYSSTLSVRKNEYVEAARAMGAKDFRILFKAILPNIWAPILVQISLSLGNAMLTESSLSFLGLGPPPYIPSWGRSISEASRFMHIYAGTLIWPALFLSLSVLAYSILGDAIRDAFDPRLKER